MEVFIILLLLIILIAVISAKGSITTRIGSLENEIFELKQTLKDVSKKTETTEPPKAIIPPKPKVEEDYWKTSFKVEETKVEEPVESKQKPNKNEEWLQEVRKENTLLNATIEPTTYTKQTTPPAPPKPGFFERNPDLEKFIGENLVSKIGIAILVLAIGYFVKFAIDNNWIGTIGRVSIGLVCGGILVVLAHRLQKNYQAFSSVLIGGGLAIFYFTIALAYHEYHLFGSITTFVIMLVITGFAVALALLYNRQEVAIIALVGGFATPFMANSGSGNYQALFIYLIVLNAGLLVLAYFKAWRLLNLLAFIFTVILFAGWLFGLQYNAPPITYSNAFIYAGIFYVMFFVINIANNIRENKKFIASDFGILLANTCLYFSVGLYCLAKLDATAYNGLFSACLGVFNLAASWLLFKNRKTDKNILYLLIGLTLTFVSLTAPLQLHGNHITLFWASESVLLYWLFQRSQIKIFQTSSLIIYGAMLVSLLMDWMNVYYTGNPALAIIFNRGFITSVYAGIASFMMYWLMHKKESPATTMLAVPGKKVFRTIALLLWYLAGLLEIIYQFKYHYPQSDIYYSYVQIYTFSYVLLLLFIAQKSAAFEFSVTNKSILLSACLLMYIAFTSKAYSLQKIVLLTQSLNTQFIITQTVIAILTAIVFYKTIMLFKRNSRADVVNASAYTWLICAAIIIFLSVEVNLLVNHIFYSTETSLDEIKRVYIKTGLPILWGLSSFAFMWAGMHYKFRPLRIISLSLFTLTLAKLFLFDIRNIPVAGKIAAFFCLGVLLLVISFMYQRLKKIIIEDEKTAAS